MIIMRSIRWSNIPIPQGHLIPLLAGLALHAFFPQQLFDLTWLRHLSGWPLLLLGGLLAAWAVAASSDRDIDRPTGIIVSGPYRFSRNPMYVAWTLIYIGISALVNTWWPLIFLPLVLVFTHFFVIRREEQRLEREFGDEYRQYCDSVRRYL
jgi:protein-S-isoprenylcysteine O-methyltransferase Ste14